MLVAALMTLCPLLSIPIRPVLLAQSSGEGGGALISMLLPLLLVFVVFYFFIIRPQRQREQQHQEMVSALKKGDKVVTIGGIHGTVAKVDETSVLVQVDGNMKLRFSKNAIGSTPGKEDE